MIVLRRHDAPGVQLVDRVTGQRCKLDECDAQYWLEWPSAALVGWHRLRELMAHGFVQQGVEDGGELITLNPQLQRSVPKVVEPYVHWHLETADLTVLFNGAPMSQNNPLLVLTPFGSLCWRGVLAGWTIGKIQAEVSRVFGCGGAIEFLDRLSRLGFVAPLPRADPVEKAGAIAEFPAPEIQFQLRQASIPWYCLWELNTACDLRCKVCYLPHFQHPGPDQSATQEIVDQIVDAGVFYAALLGGEPLLRKDLEEIVRRLRGAGTFVKIITNGQKMTAERAASLAKAGVNQIEVSFDGLDGITHEQSRGHGTFLKARHAIRLVQGAGVPRVGLVWTIHSRNRHELPQLPKFLDDLSVGECYISPFKKTGLNGAASEFTPLDITERGELVRQLIQWREDRPDLTISLLPGCSCGRTSVVIGHNGDVRTCSFSYTAAGNVHVTPLLEVWKSLETKLPTNGPAGFCTRR